MHNDAAFGWVLLAVAVLLAAAVYRLWREAATPRLAIILAGALDVILVVLVIDTWAANS